MTLEEIVSEEIDEECGYKVDKKDIKKMTSFFTNVGISGANSIYILQQFVKTKKLHSGGGINDEQIELYFLNKDDMDSFIFDETKAKTPGLIFSLYWFLKNQNELELK